MNKQTIEMMGKQIQVEISNKATQELSNRHHPLFVEMELYFSCLLRKEIRIRESIRDKIDESFTCFYLCTSHLYVFIFRTLANELSIFLYECYDLSLCIYTVL